MKEAVYHTVMESEIIAFTNHVNEVLKTDPDVGKRLPISHKEIFEAVGDGVILWYFDSHVANSLIPLSKARCLRSHLQPSILAPNQSTSRLKISIWRSNQLAPSAALL